MDDYMDAAEGLRIPVFVYWLLLAAFLIVCAIFLYRYGEKQKFKRQTTAVYLLTAIPLAFFLGRLLYSAVRYAWIYLDNMGNFKGVLPFFDPSLGGVNAIGVLLGCLLAGFITAGITKQKAGRILDAVLPYGVLLFALMRFAEPILGQGYGDWIRQPLLPFYPFGILNDWGEWQLPVCAIEGLMASLVCVVLFMQRKKTDQPGTLALYGLVLLSASQIIPQSFRQDDVLTIFIFAKVNQIGYMVLLCVPILCAGARALRRGAKAIYIIVEWIAMIIGVLLAIWCEYALDKTNLPDLLVYAIMAMVIAGMALLAVRRIHKEDMA